MDMDKLEACIEGTGDAEACRFTSRVIEMVEQMNLVKCVREKHAGECFKECLEKCRGEDCEQLCMSAIDTAFGMALALDVMEDAKVGVLMGIKLLDAVVVSFVMHVEKVWEKECPDRAVTARILMVTLTELRRLLRKNKLMLLSAPLLSAEHTCVGDEVFDFLDSIRGAVGEEMVKRIVAALEEGVVKIGRTVIKFPPVK